MGGGVGKAVSTLIVNDKIFYHQVICLEKPIDTKFFDIIKKKNKVITTKKNSIIKKYLDKVDIVQIEYWNHPQLLKTLASLKNFKQRVVLWVHQSGECYPKIPKKILRNKNMEIVFTSSRSFQFHKKLNEKNFHFISSATSLIQKKIVNKPFFKCIYIGSFHENKIYKNFISLISESLDVIGRFDMYGEDKLKKKLLPEIKKNRLQKKIYIHGYIKNIKNIYNKNSVLLYFLNKDHYGTGENVLIESMSNGIVPVVLNNSLESSLITNNVNGIILKNKNNLRNVLLKLKFNNKYRINLSKKCINFANTNFSSKLQIKKFNTLYSKKTKEIKANFNFANMVGVNAFEIFNNLLDKKIIEIEKIQSNNKGGIMHFKKIFRNDPSLLQLSKKYPLRKKII